MALMSPKARVSAAANGFRRLAANLSKVASGDVAARVLDAVVEQVGAVARSKVARHTETGYAAGNTLVKRDARGLEVSFPAYLHFHKWWPFSKGLPKFIVARASKLLAAQTAAVIAGGDNAHAALDALSEREAASSEAKKAAGKRRRAERAADRAYDKRIKAQEAREE